MGSARTEINGKRIGRGFASLSDKQQQFFEMLENKKGVSLNDLMVSGAKVVKYQCFKARNKFCYELL